MQIPILVFQLHRTLQSCLKQDGRYLLAVSGGADSMALAGACAQLQRLGWGKYSVCHVEHGLRGQEALADMQLVEKFCAQEQLPCHVEHVDVRALVAAGHASVEDAARRLRHEALQGACKSLGCEQVLLAHNRDDQAETVLLRLLRGSGLRGLGGIRSSSQQGLHPLLGFTHKELMEYCSLRGIPFCYDSSNDDLHYTRNRVRAQLLPYLAEAFNSGVRDALARTAELLQEDEECLEQLARELLAEAAEPAAAASVLRADILLGAPAALRKRALRSVYLEMSGRELDCERTLAMEQLLLRRRGGSTVQLPGGITATYEKKRIILKKI